MMRARFNYDVPTKKRGAAIGGQYRIESETVTMAEIARRLGITSSAARARMGELRGASGAITWDRLRAFGKAKAA